MIGRVDGWDGGRVDGWWKGRRVDGWVGGRLSLRLWLSLAVSGCLCLSLPASVRVWLSLAVSGSDWNQCNSIQVNSMQVNLISFSLT